MVDSRVASVWVQRPIYPATCVGTLGSVSFTAVCFLGPGGFGKESKKAKKKKSV
jgi:hypothetical protein